MGKAYLKYEQFAGFGVIASTNVPVKQINCGSSSSTSSAPLIAAASVDILTIWNMRTGESIVRFGNSNTRKAGAITCIAVSTASATFYESKIKKNNPVMIACGYTDGSIRIWKFSMKELSMYTSAFQSDNDEPQPYITFNGHRSGISSLSFEIQNHRSIDELPTLLVSGSNDGDIILWNINDSNGLFRLCAHSDCITSILLFHNNHNNIAYIVSASKDGLVKIFDTESQHCIQTITDSHGEIWSINLQYDKQFNNHLLYIGGIGHKIYLHILMTTEEQKLHQEIKESENLLDGYDRKENIFKKLGSVERSIATDRISTIECGRQSGENYVTVTNADKNAEIFRIRDKGKAETHTKRRIKRKIASIEKEVKDIAQDEGWSEDETKINQLIEERKEKEANFDLEAVDYMVGIRQLKMKKKLKAVSFLLPSTFIPNDRNLHNKKQIGIELQFIVQQRDNALEIHSMILGGSKTGSKTKKSKKKKRTSESVEDGEDTENQNDEKETEEVEEQETKENKDINEIKKLVTLDFPGHRNDIRSVSLSPQENTILTTSDGGLKLWNIATQKCVRTMKFTGYGLCTHFLGADGMIGAVGTKTGSIQIYELGSGLLISEEPNAHGNEEIWSMCLDNHIYDAKLLITGGNDKRICFWNIEDVLVNRSDDEDRGKLELMKVLEMPDQVLCIKVNYHKQRPILLVSMMDSTIRSYFLDNLQPYLNFYGHKLPCMSLDISNDGLVLVSGSADKTIKVWSMDFGDCRKSLRAHNDSILSVCFQPNTHYLFSGSKDGTIKYWDIDKFEMICELEGQRNECWAMCTSEDGEILTSTSHDRMIRIWRRTDEPIFLDEEKDKRMEELFESKLIEEDVMEASKNRKAYNDDMNDKEKKEKMGFMYDEQNKHTESLAAGKRSLETIKSGEKIMEALELCEEEKSKEQGERANPLLFGMSEELYLLKTLGKIPVSELEESLQIVPLDQSILLLKYLTNMLADDFKPIRMAVETVVKTGLIIVKMYHLQLGNGAMNRKIMDTFHQRVSTRLENARARLSINKAALHFWKNELADRDDRPFRDARARAFNQELKRKQKATRTLQAKRKQMDSMMDDEDDIVNADDR